MLALILNYCKLVIGYQDHCYQKMKLGKWKQGKINWEIVEVREVRQRKLQLKTLKCNNMFYYAANENDSFVETSFSNNRHHSQDKVSIKYMILKLNGTYAREPSRCIQQQHEVNSALQELVLHITQPFVKTLTPKLE